MLEKILNIGRKIIPKKIFKAAQPLYHLILAVVGECLYRFPGHRVRVIGVTGTNGKSTTSNLIVSILEEADFRVGLSSTTNFQIGEKKWDNQMHKTTAGRFGTFKFLRQTIKEKCDYVVVETSSHGIAQYRVWGIPYDVAVLTNISHDHLDFHLTYENYVKTKERLFASIKKGSNKKLKLKDSKKRLLVKKFIILNQDDNQFGRFNKHRADLNISYSTKNKRASVLAKNIKITKEGVSFDILTYKGNEKINLKLTGLFNVYNALAAISVGLSQEIPLKIIKSGLERVEKVNGRLETINRAGKSVIIDYAHTPDALQNIYSAVREFTDGRLIAVLGATGDRDKTKRPVMGEIAGKMCDVVFLTDEEPGDEDPKKIIEEIIPGVLKSKKTKNKDFFIIEDRKKAITAAIKEAKKDDVVIVTGIGHQKYRLVKGVDEPWDERSIIEKILK